MSRFADYCRVIVVDPPEVSAAISKPQMLELPDHGAVRLLRPMFPKHLLVEHQATQEELWLHLLPDVLALAGTNTVLWVSSPLADYLVDAALPHILFPVYDCMDDLASFKDGTAAMRVQEEHLLRLVELVLTGGRSMYEARKHRHPHVHCFPSGVDVAHYRQVRDADLPQPEELQSLAHPRLGYFGVLDERIDWSLIAEVALRRPDWQWVLVGPTAKVEPSELPIAPNIHYCGQQAYADLPAYLASFDIATLPFALNDATRFISPTKTLEYLAGGKSVISTSVPDVVATYSHIATLADGADRWIAAVEHLLAEPAAAHEQRLQRARALLEAGSWDGIAEQMMALIMSRRLVSDARDGRKNGVLHT
jgi:glycosyltransferase involved in cell wall biosynthesis